MSASVDSSSLSLSCISDLTSEDSNVVQPAEPYGIVQSGYIAGDEFSLDSSAGGSSWSDETGTEEKSNTKITDTTDVVIPAQPDAATEAPIQEIGDIPESNENDASTGQEEEDNQQHDDRSEEEGLGVPAKNLKRKRVSSFSPGREPEDLI